MEGYSQRRVSDPAIVEASDIHLHHAGVYWKGFHLIPSFSVAVRAGREADGRSHQRTRHQ